MYEVVKKDDLCGLKPGFYRLKEQFGVNTEIFNPADMLVELDDWYVFWYRRDNLCCLKDAWKENSHRLLPEEEYEKTWALVYLGTERPEL